MTIRRRLLLAAAPAMLLGGKALAQRADTRMNDRAVGSPDAKLMVQEWFSLTCTHCAHFSETVFPEIKTRLIDTGRIRYVFRDFPLDQVALAAASLARALPPERYLPFVETLFATQDSWAFNQEADPLLELSHQAALAGLSPADIQATLADQHLREEIGSGQDDAQQRYGIQGTPTFIFGGTKVFPIVDYAGFASAVDKAIAAG